MKPLWRRMTVADRLVAAGLLLVALGGVALVTAAPAGRRVVVGDGARVLFTAPLDRPQQVDIPGPLGMTRLVIDQGGARISASPCALKVCMGMGSARRPGDLLVCLPNRVLVQVEGDPGEPADYDLLSR